MDTVFEKSAEERASASMPDAEQLRQSFEWNDALSLLDGLPGGG